MSDPECAIVVACDDRYAPYAAATLYSAARNLTADFRCSLFVCTFGLLDHSLDFFRRVEEHTGRRIRVLQFNSSEYAAFPAGRYTASMYLRFDVADRLPHVKRMLYLDCDTVVLSDLAELFETDLGGAVVGAVQDCADLLGGPFHDHREGIGVPPHCQYFNSGVLLMDAELWRREQVRTRLVEALSVIGGQLRFPDQDVLNVVLADRAASLDLRWNVQYPIIKMQLCYPGWHSELRPSLSSPAIMHYCCDTKPWHRRGYVYGGGEYLNCLSKVYPDYPKRRALSLCFAVVAFWSETMQARVRYRLAGFRRRVVQLARLVLRVSLFISGASMVCH